MSIGYNNIFAIFQNIFSSHVTHKISLFCCVIWVYSIETRHNAGLFRQTSAFRCPFCCFFLIIPASYFQTGKHRICRGKHAITLSLFIHALFIGICAIFPYFSGIVRPVSLHKSCIILYVLNNTTVTPFFCLAIPSACPAIPPPLRRSCALCGDLWRSVDNRRRITRPHNRLCAPVACLAIPSACPAIPPPVSRRAFSRSNTTKPALPYVDKTVLSHSQNRKADTCRNMYPPCYYWKVTNTALCVCFAVRLSVTV